MEHILQPSNNHRILRTDNVTKSYHKRKVVNSVNLEIKEGEIVGLLGPNGAGKTTTFRMIVGLIKPDNGKVYLDNEDISKWPMHKRAQNGVGYLSQEPSIFRGLSVEDNIRAVLEVQGYNKREIAARLEELLDRINISHIAKSKAYTLSGGEKRRLEITRTLAISPSFILLDEPFSGVDPIAVAEIQSIIYDLKNMGIGILITDHQVRETLEVTDRAYILNEGQVLTSGNAKDVANDPKVVQFYLGEKFYMRHE